MQAMQVIRAPTDRAHATPAGQSGREMSTLGQCSLVLAVNAATHIDCPARSPRGASQADTTPAAPAGATDAGPCTSTLLPASGLCRSPPHLSGQVDHVVDTPQTPEMATWRGPLARPAPRCFSRP